VIAVDTSGDDALAKTLAAIRARTAPVVANDTLTVAGPVG
jgi:hypothetical protein